MIESKSEKACFSYGIYPVEGIGVFRVPKNGMLETNKPLAMRVVGNALAYRKNLQCYNNAGSPTALQAEEVSIWI